MGWISSVYPKGMSKFEILVESGEIHREKVVAHSQHGREVYVAYRAGDQVFAIVFLVEKDRKSEETAVKAMDEGMGPYYWNPSPTVLKALTPATSPTAQAWREACETRRQARLQAPKFKPEDQVKLVRDVDFGAYGTLAAGTEATIYKVGPVRAVIFVPGRGPFRLPRTALAKA